MLSRVRAWFAREAATDAAAPVELVAGIAGIDDAAGSLAGEQGEAGGGRSARAARRVGVASRGDALAREGEVIISEGTQS